MANHLYSAKAMLRQCCYLALLYLGMLQWMGCSHTHKVGNSFNDSTRVMSYIKLGDSIYARKQEIESFLKSMLYYDSAYNIAHKSNNEDLIASTLFAKGRAYDALNFDKKKTIFYYNETLKKYQKLKKDKESILYIKHLLAHSYDKALDSTNCVKTLLELYEELKNIPFYQLQSYVFIPEMAFISTTVKNYDLAENLLHNIYKRSWIKNDSLSYNYLDHYYLTQSRIQIGKYDNCTTPYLDSVEQIFKLSTNFSDSSFYAYELLQLYTTCRNQEKVIYYENINNKLISALNFYTKMQTIQEQVISMEDKHVQEKIEAERKDLLAKRRFSIVLIALLLVITLLYIFLMKRNREIEKGKREIEAVNKDIMRKNNQNETLHKELQHRVKNNLSLIVGLIDMQQRKSTSQEAIQNLQKVRARLQGIDTLHSQLSKNNTINLNVKDFFQNIINALLHCEEQPPSVALDIEELELPSTIGFPLGMILNEWLTNSLKYAQNPSGHITINISLKQNEKHYVLCYTDSGDAANAKITEGVGSDIVRLLSLQLAATLIRSPHHYFHYTLNIPK